jgi:hypothetical protein
VKNDVGVKKSEILDICITRIQSGDTTIDECLKEFSEHTGALEPLLEVAADIRSSMAPSGPSETFISTSHVRLLNRLRAAQRQPQPVKKKRTQRLRLFWQPAYRLISLLLAIVLVMTSVGVAYASSDALPGDTLYGVKRSIEEARLALTWSPIGDSELLTLFAHERLAEIEGLIATDRAEDIEVSLAGYEDIIDRLIDTADEIAPSAEPGSLEHIIENLNHHIDTLEKVREQVPPEAHKGIDRALERSRHGQEVIEYVRRGESPSDLAPGQLKKTSDFDKGNQENHGRGKPTKTPKPKLKDEDTTPGPPPWVTQGP